MEAFASQPAKLSSLLQVRQISVIRVLSPFMSQHVSFKQKWTGRVAVVPCVCAILASHVLRMSAKTLPAKMLELWFFALCSYGLLQRPCCWPCNNGSTAAKSQRMLSPWQLQAVGCRAKYFAGFQNSNDTDFSVPMQPQTLAYTRCLNSLEDQDNLLYFEPHTPVPPWSLCNVASVRKIKA